MNWETLERRLIEQANRRIADKYFPGGVVGVVNKNSEQLIVPYGQMTYEEDALVVTTDSIYDLASVTKSIPTACLLLKLIDEGTLSLDEPIAPYIPELTIKEKNNILIRHLLEFTVDYSNPAYVNQDIKHKPANQILQFLFTSELSKPPGTSYYYTNAVGILMSLVVERSSKKSLDFLANEIFFKPLGMARTSFRPGTLPKIDLQRDVAPSEVDPWRGREIRGEVHDESAWMLRNEKDMCVGSAGLFSTVPDLLKFMDMLLLDGVWDGKIT